MNSWLKRLLEHVNAWFLVLMGVSDSEMLPAHMEEPPITSSLGPTDRLIRRLRSLEGSNFKKAMLAGIDVDQIKGLREHFQEFCNPMSNLSKMDDSSFRAKWWMKEIRELCYDTEDYLEEVIMQSSVRGLRRIAGITVNCIYSKLKWRPQLSQFIARAEVLKEISQNSLQEEIKASDISLKKGNNGDISFEKENKANIERLTTNLIKLLAFDDDDKTQLKVVPISGSAGAGKTVLATTLYVMYKRKFQCRAFVRVSRNPDIRSLLTSILSQIKASPPHGFPDVMDLIVSISTHLEGKRYFIIIDDVWRTSVWDIISRAFPDGNCCSRIIITTESERVASACSESTIFKRGALDGDQSGKFSREVSGSKGDCTNTTSTDTNMVLNLRYSNLPLHLKICLLYLSIYPEGCLIMKDDMAKQWVAEGFIAALKRQGLEEIPGVPEDKKEEHSEVPQDKTEELSEVPQDNPEKIADAPQKKTEKISEVPQKETEEIARGYFDELVTRGMIQPVDRNHKGEVLSCTVHHMVLDLIRNKSKEDNFIVVVDNLQSTLGHPDIVRRMSVQFGCEKGASMPESIILSQVRSLAYYGLLGCIPSVAEYGLLRVVILHICADEDKTFDLSGIGELYHLRYLKIECNVTVRLPSMIRRLQHLGTLELHAEVVAIPSDIGHLQKLIHVLCPSKANIFDLGELKNLLDLQLTWFTLENLEENMNCLRSILEKLNNLRYLSLVPASGSCNVNTLQNEAGVSRMSISCDSLCMVSPAPSHLQRLEFSRRGCIFSRLPKWLGELAKLRILKIAVRVLYTDDIDILKGPPALTDLSLDVHTMSAETIVIGKEKLSVLTYFKFTCTVPILNFENGAMLNLELLKLCSNAPIVDEKGNTPIIAELTKDRMAAVDTNAYDVATILATGERDYLIRNSGEQVKISSIEGGTVALYFSASWCPPCRRFMPKLIEAYKELDSPAKRLEVVMVSSDRDEEAFSTYFAKMPWLAVPFSDSEGRKGLDERFEVTRVPHLVILDAKTGEVLTEEGVEFVSAYGIESYPFTPERIKELKEQEKAAKDNQTIHSLLGTPNRDYLISKKGDKVPIADLEGKYVGLCFVVNGYGPVEEFTRVLAMIYGELKKVGEKFEVVAVSIDSEEASFNESFSNMPWLAIPPGDKTCEKLVRYFELSDPPTLVLIGSDGKTLNRNIAEIVSEHGFESRKGIPFNAEKLEILAEKAKAKAESQTLDSLLVIGDLDFVIGKDGAKVPVAELAGKTVLLYFSAQWCGPARAFQTVLVDVYTKIKEKNCDFEIVFISSDRDTSSFNDFFSGMPWLALPLKDERKANLKRMFKIRGIPSVVAIGPDGKTVNTDAKTSLVVHGADAFPFTDERLQELEKKMDEMAKGWPKKLRHDLHEHELVLTRRPRPFGCDGCDGMGGSWSYRCEACDFDLHTSCALREENKGDEERLQEVEKRNDEMSKGCPSAQKKKGRPEKHMHEHVLACHPRGYICKGCDEIGTSPGYALWLASKSNILYINISSFFPFRKRG